MRHDYLDCCRDWYCQEDSPESEQLPQCHDYDNGNQRIEIHRFFEDQRFYQVSFHKIYKTEGSYNLDQSNSALELHISKEKRGEHGKNNPYEREDGCQTCENAVDDRVIDLHVEKSNGGQDCHDERDYQLPPDVAAHTYVDLPPQFFDFPRCSSGSQAEMPERMSRL